MAIATSTGAISSQRNLAFQNVLNKIPPRVIFQSIVDGDTNRLIRRLVEDCYPTRADDWITVVRVRDGDYEAATGKEEFVKALGRYARIEEIEEAEIAFTEDLPELFMSNAGSPHFPLSFSNKRVIDKGTKARIHFEYQATVFDDAAKMQRIVEVFISVKFQCEGYNPLTIYNNLKPIFEDSVRSHFEEERVGKSKTSILENYANAGEWS